MPDSPGAELPTEAEILALGEQGWFVRDGVLGPDGAAAVAAEIDALGRTGRLRPAAVGRGTGRRVDTASRDDSITWLDPAEVPPGLGPLVTRFVHLRDGLNREVHLGLHRIELQVARYPKGSGGYRRHRDAFRAPAGAPPNRLVTAIYYTNAGWRPEDGGRLRLHLPRGPRDVDPVADRMLVFLSERIEHEVLPTTAARSAVTAWFRARGPLDADAGTG